MTLVRTLKHCAVDFLPHFDHLHTTSSPTEAINGRVEDLSGSTLGF